MNELIKKIESYPIIPVFYHDDLDICKNMLDGCYKGGIRIFEFVNRGSKALENFKKLNEYRNQNYPDLTLAIGTIKTKEEAISFLEIGADVIVSPIINIEIAEVTLNKNILWIPGVMTPTEIALAEKIGAPMVKLFPGDVLGTTFLNAIKPLFPTMKFMPTGGVKLEQENINNWFKAGVIAVGLGSKLFIDTEKNPTLLQQRVEQLFDWVNQTKR